MEWWKIVLIFVGCFIVIGMIAGIVVLAKIV